MYEVSSMQLCPPLLHLTLLSQNRDFEVSWVFLNYLYLSMLATSRGCSDVIFIPNGYFLLCELINFACEILGFWSNYLENLPLMIFLAFRIFLAYVDMVEASKAHFDLSAGRCPKIVILGLPWYFGQLMG